MLLFRSLCFQIKILLEKSSQNRKQKIYQLERDVPVASRRHGDEQGAVDLFNPDILTAHSKILADRTECSINGHVSVDR